MYANAIVNLVSQQVYGMLWTCVSCIAIGSFMELLESHDNVYDRL